MREKRAKTCKMLENDIKPGWMILQDTHFTLWRNTGHSPLERRLRQTHLAGYIHKDTWFQLSSNILVLVKLDHFHFPLIEHCLLIGVKICLKKVMTHFNLPYILSIFSNKPNNQNCPTSTMQPRSLSSHPTRVANEQLQGKASAFGGFWIQNLLVRAASHI